MTSESSVAINRRVSYAQLESLWEMLNSRREIALGFNKSTQDREFARRMWEEVAITLNSQAGGVIKDGKGWSKYWNDYKSKLKKTALDQRSSDVQTDGDPPQSRSLTGVEKKFLQLIGHKYCQGLSITKVKPFEELSIFRTYTPILEQELKMERLEGSFPTSNNLAERVDTPPALLTSPAQPSSPVLPTSAAHSTSSWRGRSPRHRARRQRGNPPMTHEAARRALVECSQQQLAVSERKAAALEQLCTELQCLRRIISERFPLPPVSEQ